MAWKTGHACAKSAGGIVAPPQLEDHQGPERDAQIPFSGKMGLNEAANFCRVEEVMPREHVLSEQFFHERAQAPSQPLRDGNLKATLVAMENPFRQKVGKGLLEQILALAELYDVSEREVIEAQIESVKERKKE